MSSVLPLPRRTLAIPLAALALGAAGGTTAALIIAEGDTIIRSSAPAVQVRDLPRGATPVPERVSPAPVAPSKSSSPAPERVSPAPPQTSSLAGTSSGTQSSKAPVPERISGVRTR